MVWIAWIAIGFLLMRLLVVLANGLTPVVLPRTETDGEQALVSILIPARNEAHTIGPLLDSLLVQDYQHIEILVYDDVSTDATPDIVHSFAAKDDRIQYMRGHGLPEGWLGKNHACHQLAGQARGQYLLFLDADVKVNRNLLADALSHLKKHQLHLLSLFPNQQMKSFGERITVPVMNWILLSLLPLILTRLSNRPSLAAANGQFMLFQAKSYHARQWHWQVRKSPVEDIVIARNMKKAGYKIQTMVPDGQIQCRMYQSFKEAVKGLSRSVPEFFGGSWLWLLFFTVFSSAGFLFVALAFSWVWAVFYIVVTLLMRGIIARLSRQPVGSSVLYAPLIHLAFLVMVVFAAYSAISGNMQWKGRKI